MSNTVKSLLDELSADRKAERDMLAQVTQRMTAAGEIAYKRGETYTPTLQDLALGLVNDDPNHRMPDGFGSKANNLFQNQGRLILAVSRAQEAAKVPVNSHFEVLSAADTGDYSKIRGA